MVFLARGALEEIADTTLGSLHDFYVGRSLQHELLCRRTQRLDVVLVEVSVAGASGNDRHCRRRVGCEAHQSGDRVGGSRHPPPATTTEAAIEISTRFTMFRPNATAGSAC